MASGRLGRDTLGESCHAFSSRIVRLSLVENLHRQMIAALGFVAICLLMLRLASFFLFCPLIVLTFLISEGGD